VTKDEFVALVADRGGLSRSEAGRSEAGRAVEAFCGAVSDAMARGEEVRLPGFGGFAAAQRGERGERAGRNLRTGEAITIPAAKAVKFSAGARLKEAVNGRAG
jgi:DNA-binding protein HU-beta